MPSSVEAKPSFYCLLPAGASLVVSNSSYAVPFRCTFQDLLLLLLLVLLLLLLNFFFFFLFLFFSSSSSSSSSSKLCQKTGRTDKIAFKSNITSSPASLHHNYSFAAARVLVID